MSNLVHQTGKGPYVRTKFSAQLAIYPAGDFGYELPWEGSISLSELSRNFAVRPVQHHVKLGTSDRQGSLCSESNFPLSWQFTQLGILAMNCPRRGL